jgi:heme-degrading monooxygenase HmoA
MITEIALLHIKENQSPLFELAFAQAKEILSRANGYIEHELQKSMEHNDKYLLVVRWQNKADHTEGFRKSEGYKDWKNLLHHFYDPFPEVEYYELIFK